MSGTLGVFFLVGITLVVVILGISTHFFRLGKQSQSRRGIEVGLIEDQFSLCSDYQCCVNSQAEMTDRVHYIKPLRYDISQVDARTALLNIIHGYPRVTLGKVLDYYLWFEFRSGTFGFVDDVEFYFPDNDSIVHVRSGSRVGKYDFGVNRSRIEKIRRAFEDLVTVL